MRYTQAEKMEIIRLVERSALPATRVLDEIGVSRSTFYHWYRRFKEYGYDGLAARATGANRFWNRIQSRQTGSV